MNSAMRACPGLRMPMAALFERVKTTDVAFSHAIFLGFASGGLAPFACKQVPGGFFTLHMLNSSMSFGLPKAIPARRKKPILSDPNSVKAITVPFGEAATPKGWLVAVGVVHSAKVVGEATVESLPILFPNALENSVKYTPAPAPLDMSAIS